jgi:hypothetical protein
MKQSLCPIYSFPLTIVDFRIMKREGAKMHKVYVFYNLSFSSLIEIRKMRIRILHLLFCAISCNTPHTTTYPPALSTHLCSQT